MHRLEISHWLINPSRVLFFSNDNYRIYSRISRSTYKSKCQYLLNI
jgi:hypothetical protein